MRRLLLDHARRRQRVRHGGGHAPVRIDDVQVQAGERPVAFLALDAALESLGVQDPRKAQILELEVFGGLSRDELAEVVGVSSATVGRELRLARAFVARAMRHES
jgi:RNA polymerase sigma factor (TIGR02999 family)